MALTNVQQNIVSELQALAGELLSIKNRLNSLTEMYTNEGIGALTDADFQLYAEFVHITAAELSAAAGALVAVNTALGDFTAGSNVSKLLKILRNVPR